MSSAAALPFDEIDPRQGDFSVDCCLSYHSTTSHGWRRGSLAVKIVIAMSPISATSLIASRLSLATMSMLHLREALFAQDRSQKSVRPPLRHRTPARCATLRLKDRPSDIAGLAAALLFHRRC